MTREQLTELIDFAKESKLEKESLQEVLYQKDFADFVNEWPYLPRLARSVTDAELASYETYYME